MRQAHGFEVQGRLWFVAGRSALWRLRLLASAVLSVTWLAAVVPGSAAAAAPVEESVRVGPAQPAYRAPSASPYGTAVPTATPYGTAPPTAVAQPQASPYGAAPAPAPAPTAAGGRSELFLQVQSLQQEVAQLRGLVEELTHQVNRLASDQQAQYRDLDARMVALRGGAGAAAGVPPTVPVAAPAPGAVNMGQTPVAPSAGAAAQPAPGAGAQQGDAGPDRDAYSAAFELMRARKFPEATAAFDRFVRDYPNSGYTANAFYWLGELHLAQNAFEPARQSFMQVVNLYPDSQKMPDALYKLGVVHHRIGDPARAREYLNRTISQFPSAPAAALAQTYLAELQ